MPTDDPTDPILTLVAAIERAKSNKMTDDEYSLRELKVAAAKRISDATRKAIAAEINPNDPKCHIGGTLDGDFVLGGTDILRTLAVILGVFAKKVAPTPEPLSAALTLGPILQLALNIAIEGFDENGEPK